MTSPYIARAVTACELPIVVYYTGYGWTMGIRSNRLVNMTDMACTTRAYTDLRDRLLSERGMLMDQVV